jgi:hypothetical protein
MARVVAWLLGLWLLGCEQPTTREAPPAPSVFARPPPSVSAAPEQPARAASAASGSSYVHAFSSARLDSHVHVPMRSFEGLTRWALDACPAPGPSPPLLTAGHQALSVVVSPNAEHIAVFTDQAVYAFSPNGYCRTTWRWARSQRQASGEAFASNRELFIDGAPHDWSLGALKDQRLPRGRALAVDMTSNDFVALTIGESTTMGRRSFPYLALESTQRWSTGKTHWYGSIPRHTGNGAIADDWSVVVATDDARLLIFAPRARDWEGNVELVAERRVGKAPRWLSIVGENIALLTPTRTGIGLGVFNTAGTPLSSIDLPMLATQPPIWGGGQRVYVIGNGLAALDAGKAVWSLTLDEAAYATSFADGSLAVAHGSQISFRDSTGALTQSFRANEPLMTPPAIASDGSVWVASSSALYAVR